MARKDAREVFLTSRNQATMTTKLTMISIHMGDRSHTRFVHLPVDEDGKVRADYFRLFTIPRGWCVALGR